MIAENIAAVKKSIQAACQRSGRELASVRLVAVSKTKSANDVAAAIKAGVNCFGENYMQEASQKIAELRSLGLQPEFHFIGALQRNKASDAVRLFSLLHSVDRESLAEALAKAAQKANKVQEVLVQVNVSGEQSKSGIQPEAALSLCRNVHGFPSLRLRGLMCIGEYGVSEPLRRAEFQLLRKLRDSIEQDIGQQLPELSMGMSEDYAWAVEEGATLVRVGTSIFGERS